MSKKLGLSLSHNWLLAAERCCSRVDRVFNDVPYSVSKIKDLIEQRQKKEHLLSVIVAELLQLWQEFENVDFDRETNSLSVETESITLEDVYLGLFKVELHLGKLSELHKGRPYDCIALEPNPVATAGRIWPNSINSNITINAVFAA